MECVQSRTSASYMGAYFYTNNHGCDGSRLIFDCSSFVIQNQEIIHVGESCPLNDVVVKPVVLDIGAIKSKGIGNINDMRETALLEDSIPQLMIDFSICARNTNFKLSPTKLKTPFKIECKESQILKAITSYIWDYLKKSGSAGFLLPLSGGADSGLTAAIIYHFANRLLEYLTERGEEIRAEILSDLRKIVKDESFDPKTPKEIVSKIFYTRYMGTNNSSEETKKRAAKFAEQIGANHASINISGIC